MGSLLSLSSSEAQPDSQGLTPTMWLSRSLEKGGKLYTIRANIGNTRALPTRPSAPFHLQSLDPREVEAPELEKGQHHTSAGPILGNDTGPGAHGTCARLGIIPRMIPFLVLFFCCLVILTQCRDTRSRVADVVARVTQLEQAAYASVSAQPPTNIRTTQPARHPNPDITVPRPQWEPARIRGGRVLCCCGKGANVTIEPPREGPGLPHPPNIPPEGSLPHEFIVGPPPPLLPRPDREMTRRPRVPSSATEREPNGRSRVPSHAKLPTRSRLPSQTTATQEAHRPGWYPKKQAGRGPDLKGGGGTVRSRAGSHASQSRSRRPSQAGTMPPVPPLPA